MGFKSLIPVSRFLGAMSLLLLFLTGLALMDIAGGQEPNLLLEWIMVWLTIPWVFVSVVTGLVVSVAMGRRLKKLESENVKLRIDDANS